MKKKKPVPPNERKLRRKLSELAEQARLFLHELDRLMNTASSAERGRAIAKLCNRFEVYNDGIRYFWCGVDYRKDSAPKGPQA